VVLKKIKAIKSKAALIFVAKDICLNIKFPC
jgi:hypothetical protein